MHLTIAAVKYVLVRFTCNISHAVMQSGLKTYQLHVYANRYIKLSLTD